MRRSGDAIFFLQNDGRTSDEEQSRNEESARAIAGLGELDTVEQAIFDGWRYLGLDDAQILSKTPREFTILMQAQLERQYDEYERIAIEAIMREAAHRAKRPKAGDLFKRPKDSVAERNNLSDMKQETERLNDWLATLQRKEEANGD